MNAAQAPFSLIAAGRMPPEIAGGRISISAFHPGEIRPRVP
jgi:hypothetical protein